MAEPILVDAMSVSRSFVLTSVVVAVVTRSAVAAGPAPPEAPVVVKVNSGGFHWLDAGAGAAAAFALVLLVVGLTLSVRHANRTYGEEQGK